MTDKKTNRNAKSSDYRPRRKRASLRTTNTRLLIVTAAVCACYAYFVHLPAREESRALLDELDSVELELAEADTLPLRLADAIRRRDEAREYIDDWKGVSPRAADAASFGAVIAQIVSEAGAKTDRLVPQSEIPFESLGQVPITFEFDGFFHQAFEVLSQLESRDESIWIDEFALEKRDEQSIPRLHCLMKLAVFTDKSKNSD